MVIKYTCNDINLNIWENCFWLTLFSISFSFTNKKNALRHIKFINNMMYVIPCTQYRKMYECVIINIPLTIDIVSNNEAFSKWIYTVMKLIQKKLNIKFVYNYDELKNYFINGPGLYTDYWGFFLWRFMHAVTFGYSGKFKNNYFLFFKYLKYIIICTYCRRSYKDFVEHDENLVLNANVFNNKESLTKWLYNLHNKVNFKLEKKVEISYEEVCKFYAQ